MMPSTAAALHTPVDLGAAAASLACPIWRALVGRFGLGPQGLALAKRLRQELAQHTVYPPPQQWLRALALLPLAQVRVCIVGQDPYHGPGQAEGLAFSVAQGQALPRSLIHILRECGGVHAALPTNGSLLRWSAQGVLLLNTVFTVRAGQPASHAGWGWEGLSLSVLRACAERAAPTVFMLWGHAAQQILPLIAPSVAAPGFANWAQASAVAQAIPMGPHLVLLASHPSPLAARRGARPFVGCDHFAQANAFLQARGNVPIAW